MIPIESAACCLLPEQTRSLVIPFHKTSQAYDLGLFLTNWQDVIAAVVTAAVSDMRIREPAVGIPIMPARNFSSFMASRN